MPRILSLLPVVLLACAPIAQTRPETAAATHPAEGSKVEFFGVAARARSVVFVCDASGSMMAKFDALRVQLAKAVAALDTSQSFGVIFFNGKGATFLDNTLVLADANHKLQFQDFLDNADAFGMTDPLPALKLAFDQQPDVIYFLTDGDFPDNQVVIDYIAERTKERKVKINTIAFAARGEDYETVLKKIASQTGGVYTYVSEDDLAK